MSGRFGTLLTAMVTPFRDDYSLDLEGAQAAVLELGIAGLEGPLGEGAGRHDGQIAEVVGIPEDDAVAASGR